MSQKDFSIAQSVLAQFVEKVVDKGGGGQTTTNNNKSNNNNNNNNNNTHANTQKHKQQSSRWGGRDFLFLVSCFLFYRYVEMDVQFIFIVVVL